MANAALRVDLTDNDLPIPRWSTPQLTPRRAIFGVRTGRARERGAVLRATRSCSSSATTSLRLLREPLLLDGRLRGAARVTRKRRSLHTLMVLVPIYGAAFRRTAPRRLVRFITVFFVAEPRGVLRLGNRRISTSAFAYYVWVGVFGVTMLAQFWAHATHSFDVASGQRLFPLVMLGSDARAGS